MVLLVWWVVAHNSGSGWVQVLGDAVFGMLLVGLFGPGFAVTRVRLEVAQNPMDAAAGLPALIRIRTTAPCRLRPVEPPGPETLVGRNRAGVNEHVSLLPIHRGVYDQIIVAVATSAPFGLQWWTRRVVVPLPVPLHVAPRLGRPIQLPRWVDDRRGSAGSPIASEAGDARGVREYRPGDRRSRLHWVASAHAGHLMVRETEEPAAEPVTLNIALPADPEAAERTAGQALATTVKLLDRGVRVVLATHELSGKVLGPVADRREAGRRLARATSDPTRMSGVELLR